MFFLVQYLLQLLSNFPRVLNPCMQFSKTLLSCAITFVLCSEEADIIKHLSNENTNLVLFGSKICIDHLRRTYTCTHEHSSFLVFLLWFL